MKRKWEKVDAGIYKVTGAKGVKYVLKRMVSGKSISESYDTLSEANDAKESFKTATKRFGASAAMIVDMDWAEFTQAKKMLPEGVTLIDAVSFYVAAKVNPDRPSNIQIAGKNFLDYKESRLRAKTYTDLKYAIAELQSRFGRMSLERVSQENILAVFKEMEKMGKSPRTIKNLFSYWRMFWNWCVRRLYVQASPMALISAAEDLPKIRTAAKHPLSAKQAAAFMSVIETEFPEHAMWAALQLFLGFRSGEVSRFHYEWIQPDVGRVYIPDVHIDENGKSWDGTKTGDAWAIHDIEPNFWKWYEAYGKKKGRVKGPFKAKWMGSKGNPKWKAGEEGIRGKVLKAMGLADWPENTKRDSFCTHHISLYRDPGRTALVLKHTNTETLKKSYLGTMVAEKEARAYFDIFPVVTTKALALNASQ